MRRGGARCVCGRSATFPVCDGSHQEPGWRCGVAAPFAPVVVIGGHHLRTVAERLAEQEGGVAAHRVEGPLRAARTVVLSDGTDLDEVAFEARRVTTEERLAIAIDVPAAALGSALPGWPVVTACSDHPRHLWRSVRTALEAPRAMPGPLARAFVSHAVADEPRLLGPLRWLREHARAELFVCSDSIDPGTRWLDRILLALGEVERFTWILSSAASGSTFCAFEVGWARARGLPIHLISLDGTPPPAFVADLHAVDLTRSVRERPWLSPEEALIDALLDVLASEARLEVV